MLRACHRAAVQDPMSTKNRGLILPIPYPKKLRRTLGVACVNFLGSSMHAMMRTAPPQSAQVSMSTRHTRLRRCAQVIAAGRSAGVLSSVRAWGVAPLPRPARVTRARCRLCGANTPC